MEPSLAVALNKSAFNDILQSLWEEDSTGAAIGCKTSGQNQDRQAGSLASTTVVRDRLRYQPSPSNPSGFEGERASEKEREEEAHSFSSTPDLLTILESDPVDTRDIIAG
jgi:hypothetical protein